MKIERDRSRKMWTLTSGAHVLYCGRRSPWENPGVMRDALVRERELASSVGLASERATRGSRHA